MENLLQPAKLVNNLSPMFCSLQIFLFLPMVVYLQQSLHILNRNCIYESLTKRNLLKKHTTGMAKK